MAVDVIQIAIYLHTHRISIDEHLCKGFSPIILTNFFTFHTKNVTGKEFLSELEKISTSLYKENGSKILL